MADAKGILLSAAVLVRRLCCFTQGCSETGGQGTASPGKFGIVGGLRNHGNTYMRARNPIFKGMLSNKPPLYEINNH